MKKGYCPKCHRIKWLTRHHVYPSRFFPRSSAVLYICRDCHDELEALIPVRKKQKRYFYEEVIREWLGG